MTIVLVRGDWASTADAEHAVAVPAPAIACTHFTGGRVVVTTTDPAGAEVLAHDGLPGTLRSAVAAHAGRWGGRAFAYPGSDLLVGVLSVAQILGATAVDAVIEVGRPDDLPGDRAVDTCGFVRPVFCDGRLELLVRPAVGGTLVPFEQRVQIACCTDHA